MTFNLRSFAAVLSKMQGGINLKPGQTVTLELSDEQLEKIFDGRPAAFAGYGLIIQIKRSGDKPKLVIRRED
jgi:hypothetical protein